MQEIATQLLKLIREEFVNWEEVIEKMDDFLQAYEATENKENNFEVLDGLKELIKKESVNAKELMQLIVNECVEKAGLYLLVNLKSYKVENDKDLKFLEEFRNLRKMIFNVWLPLVGLDLKIGSYTLPEALSRISLLYGMHSKLAVQAIIDGTSDPSVTFAVNGFRESYQNVLIFLQEQSLEVTVETQENVSKLFKSLSELEKYLEEEDLIKIHKFVLEVLEVYTPKAIIKVQEIFGLKSDEYFLPIGHATAEDGQDETQLTRLKPEDTDAAVLERIKKIPAETIELAVALLKSLQVALFVDDKFSQKYRFYIDQLIFGCQGVVYNRVKPNIPIRYSWMPVLDKEKTEWEMVSEVVAELTEKLASLVQLELNKNHEQLYKLFSQYFQLKQRLVTEYPLLSELSTFTLFFEKFYQQVDLFLEKYLPIALDKINQILQADNATLNAWIQNPQSLMEVSFIQHVLEIIAAIPRWKIQNRLVNENNGIRFLQEIINCKMAMEELNQFLIGKNIKLPSVRTTQYSDFQPVISDEFVTEKLKRFNESLNKLEKAMNNSELIADVVRFYMQQVFFGYKELVGFKVLPNLKEENYSYQNDKKLSKENVILLESLHKQAEIFVQSSFVNMENLLQKDDKDLTLQEAIFLVNEIRLLSSLMCEIPVLKQNPAASQIQDLCIFRLPKLELKSQVVNEQTESTTNFSVINTHKIAKELEMIFFDIPLALTSDLACDRLVRNLQEIKEFQAIDTKVKVLFPIEQSGEKWIKKEKTIPEIIQLVEVALVPAIKAAQKIKLDRAEKERKEKEKKGIHNQFVKAMNIAYVSVQNLEPSFYQSKIEDVHKNVQDSIAEVFRVAVKLKSLICEAELFELKEQSDPYAVIPTQSLRGYRSRKAMGSYNESSSVIKLLTLKQWLEDLVKKLYEDIESKVGDLSVQRMGEHCNPDEMFLQLKERYKPFITFLSELLKKPEYIELLPEKFLTSELENLNKAVMRLEDKLLIIRARKEIEGLSNLSFLIRHPSLLISLSKKLSKLNQSYQELELLIPTEINEIKTMLINTVGKFYLDMQKKIIEIIPKKEKKTDCLNEGDDAGEISDIKILADSLLIIKAWFLEFSGESLTSKPEGFLTAICQILFNHAKPNEEVKNLEMCQALLNLLGAFSEIDKLAQQKVKVITKVNLVFDGTEEKTIADWKIYFDKLVPELKIEELVVPKNNANVQEDLPFVNPSPVSQPSSSSGNGQALKPSSSNPIISFLSNLTK